MTFHVMMGNGMSKNDFIWHGMQPFVLVIFSNQSNHFIMTLHVLIWHDKAYNEMARHDIKRNHIMCNEGTLHVIKGNVMAYKP